MTNFITWVLWNKFEPTITMFTTALKPPLTQFPKSWQTFSKLPIMRRKIWVFGKLQAPKIECSFSTFLSWLDFWKRLFTFGSLFLVQFSLQGKFNLDLSFTFLAFLHDWITNESVFVVFLILICFTGCQVYVCFVQWNTLYIISLGCIELSNTFFKVDWLQSTVP